MFTLIVLAVYTILILAFVPLDGISKAQIKVKAAIKKIIDKANS